MTKVEADARALMARMGYDQKVLLSALMDGADMCLMPEVFMMADGTARECGAVDLEVYANYDYRRAVGDGATDADAVAVLYDLQEVVLGTRAGLNVGEYMVFDSLRQAPEHHLVVRTDMAAALGRLMDEWALRDGIADAIAGYNPREYLYRPAPSGFMENYFKTLAGYEYC